MGGYLYAERSALRKHLLLMIERLRCMKMEAVSWSKRLDDVLAGESILTEETYGPDGEVDRTGVMFGYGELVRTLIGKKKTVATMESCTGGQIASLLTDTEGSSAVFRGGFVTYCNEAKVFDGVPESVIEKFGVYSSETAAFMAEACRAKLGSDIGIGITGSFGNADPNNADSVPGEVYFAVSDSCATRCYHCMVPAQSSRLSYKLYIAGVVAAKLFVILDRKPCACKCH